MDLISVNAQIKANQYLSETLAQLEKDFLMIIMTKTEQFATLKLFIL